MRTNLPRWLVSLIALPIASCTPVQEESYGSGFVVVNEFFWGANYNTPYPFTTDGELSCGIHPEFGPAVYFEPTGFTGESSIGTPINKAAAESLKQANLTPNVPYSIKEDADLNKAREIGLGICIS